MSVNFDEMIDRRNTHSSKWDGMEATFGVSSHDGIAMWVADMDFRPPQAVDEAMKAMLEHGVYGYFADASGYTTALSDWFRRNHGWAPEPAWMAQTHGIVPGIGVALRAFTEPGDGIVVFSPVYHAFGRIVQANLRRLVESELALRDGRYHMDLDALEAQLDGSEKMVLFCSPHNPGGRVWEVDELRALGDFCTRHDLLLVSDEIHCDLVFPGHKHTVFANACPEVLDRLIITVSSTKTFNIAGIETGTMIIPDTGLRRRFDAAHMATGKSPNRFGMILGEAAFNGGDAWRRDLVDYLDGNRRLLDEALNQIPGVWSMPLQATYLSWADFAGTGMDHAEINRRLLKSARIAASPGPQFGKGGESWMRFNIATPRVRVAEAALRIQEAFADLQ